MANEYDVVVIGSGTGGYVAAIRAAQLGLKHGRRRARAGARRHLPELGLHPDQGAPRARARAQGRAGLEGLGADDRRGGHRHRHGPGAGAQGQDRQGADRRHRAAVQEEQDRLDQGQRPAGRQGHGRDHRRRRQQTLTATQGDHRRDRLAAAQRAGHRDRSQADHHERRSDRPEGRSRSRSSSSGSGAVGVEFASIFRRFGSEVTIIELLPRLVPVEDEAVSAELERVVQEAGHQGADRHEGHERQGRRRAASRSRRRLPDGKTAQAQRRVPARRDRPRPGHRPASARRKRACGWSAATSTSTREFRDQRARHLGHRRRHHLRQARPPAARAPLVGRGHRARRAHRRPGVPADQLRPGARLHLLRSGDRQRRPDREGSAGSAATTSRSARSSSASSARARIAGETEGFVKIVADKKYDEILGVHMIGPRVDRARRRSDARAAPRVHGRGADPHDPRAPDDVGGRGRSRARRRTARRFMRSVQLRRQ